ncbi:MAG: alpha/beta fold hydrolase [Gallionellaceae bacterium]
MMGGEGRERIQADTASLALRHKPSGLNSSFTSSQLTFPQYIAASSEMIAQARAGVAPKLLNKIVAGNAPFELHPADGFVPGKDKPYRRGILLVHGLSDSPYFMRHLAHFFQDEGFRVMAVLLPGHGTQPGDLLDVYWQDWLKTVTYGVEQLALEVDEIYLGGYSAGGALSVCQSLCDVRILGLFLFAPALKVSTKAAFANVHKSYSWLCPSAKWLSLHLDNDIYKYESFPKNAAAQMYALTQALLMLNRKMQIPVFAAISQDDETVDSAATIEFMRHAEHPESKLVYYFSDEKKISRDCLNANTELVNSVISEKKIISSAHTAIVLPAEDTYYGENGEYRNCLHYRANNIEKYEACMHGDEAVVSGEITRKNLHANTVRRLMHNPSFSSLQNAMRQFISRLSA